MESSGRAAVVCIHARFVIHVPSCRSSRETWRRIAAWLAAMQKAAGVRPLIIARQLAGAAQNVFVGGQAVKADGAAGVQVGWC